MPERSPTPYPLTPAESRSTRGTPLPKGWDYLAGAGGPYLMLSAGESDHWVLDLGGLLYGDDNSRSIGGEDGADISFPVGDLQAIEGRIERNSKDEWLWAPQGRVAPIIMREDLVFDIGRMRATFVPSARFFPVVAKRLYPGSNIVRGHGRGRGLFLEHLIQEAGELEQARFRERYPGSLLIAFSLDPFGARISSLHGTHGVFGLAIEGIRCWPILDTAVSYELGRNRRCDIVLEAPSVSRRHLRLYQDSSGWGVQDIKSTNGTVLNGERLKGRSRLAPSSLLHLGGRALLLFLSGDQLWPILRSEDQSPLTDL